MPVSGLVGSNPISPTMTTPKHWGKRSGDVVGEREQQRQLYQYWKNSAELDGRYIKRICYWCRQRKSKCKCDHKNYERGWIKWLPCTWLPCAEYCFECKNKFKCFTMARQGEPHK